jgi:hypothetical protein
MLVDVRVRLRSLVRFIDPEQAKADVYTKFEYEIGEGAGEYKSSRQIRHSRITERAFSVSSGITGTTSPYAV